MTETECPVLPSHGKLHERLSDHDVELAEMREYMRSLDRSTEETKRAIKAMQETLAKTNELLHAANVKDERLFSHMKHSEDRFEKLETKIDENNQQSNERIDKVQDSLRRVALSLFLAFALGAGAMVTEYAIGGLIP